MLNYVVGWQCRSLLTCMLQYLATNVALLVQNFMGDFILSKFVFGYFKSKKRKKVPMTTKKGRFLRLHEGKP